MSNKKTYQSIQDLINQRFDSNKIQKKLNFLKNELDSGSLTVMIDELSKRIPIYKKHIFGNLFPKKNKDLGGSQNLFFKPKNVEKEIAWQIISIRNNIEQIKCFVRFKREFEHLFLLGNYEKANDILIQVYKTLGVSIWYYESKFSLLEYQDKSDEKLKLLSDINQEIGENHSGFVTILLHFISHRTERNLSAYKYDYDLNSYFRKNRTDYQKDNCDYSLFRLNYFKNYSIDNLDAVFTFENTNSLIDRYLMLIHVLQSLAANDKEQNFVSRKATYLYEKTADEIFIPLFACQFPEKIPSVYYDKKYIQIVDYYYSGNYESVIESSKAYIKEDSSCFDVLVFYCRSLIALRMSYLHITSNVDSLFNQVGLKVFNSLTNENGLSDTLYNLYQKNKNIYSFRLAYGLDYYINTEENNGQSIKLKLLSLCHFDPLFSKIFKEEEESEMYLIKGLEYMEDSVCIRQQLRRLKREVTHEGEVSDYIREIDNAKILFYKEEFDQSLSQWQDIQKKYVDFKPIFQVALQYTFQCLSNKTEYLKAIKFYVNNFIENEGNVSKIDVNGFILTLKSIKYKNIRRCIELPIFVGLNAGDDADKSFILQSYCDVYNKTKPSDLFDDLAGEDIKKIECFYSVIYKEDTLRHLIHINSTLENLRESQRIMKYLVDLNTNNKESYQKQLDVVSNELIVYEGSQKLDESKIYANDQAIISNELKDIDGLYNRLRSIYKLSVAGSVIWIIKEDSYQIVGYNDESKKKDPGVKFTDNALLEVFYSIFDLVRDKFLNSKYGIVAYLSTRIRHGVLEGELRPEIDKFNLILNMQNSKYVPTRYWKIKYGIDDKTDDVINKELIEFSKGVDNLLHYFIKEKLQIKDPIHKDGLFNYDISNEELQEWAYEIGNITNDYQECCTYIIDKLWIITNKNLEIIRCYIDKDVTDEFYQLFNGFRIQLLRNIDDKDFPDIYTAINSASTIINQRLRKIEGWFKISGSTFDDFNLERLLNLVWDNTSRCYPKENVELQFECVKNINIRGSYLIHFSDLFRIFLDNMFKYGIAEVSGKKLFSINCEIINSDVLKCTFENRAHKTIELADEAETTSDNKPSFLVEGKSGIYKAKKIANYDLDCYENEVSVLVKDDMFIVVIEINISKLLVDETNIDHRG